jgi:hypothetical protein
MLNSSTNILSLPTEHSDGTNESHAACIQIVREFYRCFIQLLTVYARELGLS